MDTIITIKISEKNDDILKECERITLEFEKLVSKTIDESEISNFNFSKNGIDGISSDTAELIGKAIDAADNTNGLFNFSIGAVIDQWQNQVVPENLKVDHIDYKKIQLNGNKLSKTDSELKIDLGAAAKGYICEKIVDYLKNKGIGYGILSFGGNIGVFGSKPDKTKWKIGIRDPYNTDDVIGYININSGYVSVSGDYQRWFEYEGEIYHHIIDPRTCYPVDNGTNSVVVWCEDGTIADALSTALFVMGADEGLEFQKKKIYKFEVMYICGGKITMSGGFAEMYESK